MTKKQTGIKHAPIFQLKAVEEKGEFEGYASTFGGEPDAYGDIIAPGAYSETLEEHKAAGTMPLLLFGHDRNDEIGEIVELKEDDKGLYMRAKLWIDGDNPDPSALKAYRGMTKSNGKMGLSIGYFLREWRANDDGTWLLENISLREVSAVTFPANDAARVDEAKDTPVTKRDLERGLIRDLGLTEKQAKTLIAEGYEAAFVDRDGDDNAGRDALKGLTEKLRGLSK